MLSKRVTRDCWQKQERLWLCNDVNKYPLFERKTPGRICTSTAIANVLATKLNYSTSKIIYRYIGISDFIFTDEKGTRASFYSNLSNNRIVPLFIVNCAYL